MFLYVNVVAEQCSDGVCLTWKVSEEQLTLICKVGQILHRVKIVNPSGCLQGEGHQYQQQNVILITKMIQSH